MPPRFVALVSSDWNECLAPCTPFDCLAHTWPNLENVFSAIFNQYTGHRMALSAAMEQISQVLPAPFSRSNMDAYLQMSFATYPGVSALISWCRDHNVLFMINTTGLQGYFQRVFALGLLPTAPVLAAHPLISYPVSVTDPPKRLDLAETEDKGRYTQRIAEEFDIAPRRIIVLGDSAGDGPHFAWGAGVGAFLIGSMTKPSLTDYCRRHGIGIDLCFGQHRPDLPPGQPGGSPRPPKIDFRDLIPAIQSVVAR